MPKDWDSVKAHIERLYLRENKSLSQVVVLMKTNYGFDASVRAYRMRLSDWGYHKSISRDKTTIQKKALFTKPPTLPFNQRVEQLDSYFTLATSSILVIGSTADIPFKLRTFPSTPELEPNPVTFPCISNIQDFLSGFNALPYSEANVETLISEITPVYNSQPLQILLQAISNSSLETIANYISWSMDLANQQDANRKSLLHYTAEQGVGEFVQLLIAGGADVNSVDCERKTPLHHAVRSPKAVAALLEHHPKISPQDAYGNTPLHLAISSCNLDDPLESSSINLLVRAKADVNTLNYKNESPLLLLFRSKSTAKTKLDIVKMLSTEGDLKLWKPDSSMNPPIYEASRLENGGDSLIRYILDDGNSEMFESEMFRVPEKDLCSACRYWLWRGYFRCIEEGEYHELENFIIYLDQYAPDDLLRTLRPLACAYAVEKLLIGAKKEFEKGLAGGATKIVSILKFSQELSIEVDPKWYGFLLELFN